MGRSSAWESELGRRGHEKVFRKQDREWEVEEIKNPGTVRKRRSPRGLQSPAGSR